MNSFINDVNFFGNINPESLLERFGSPLYVYNEAILRDRLGKVRKLITKYPYTANYSIKANSNLHILKIALEEGMNCDAMSIGEVLLLKKAGFDSDKIFFVPNNVSGEELKQAIELGVTVSLDSLSQLELFGKINRGGSCAVRINPGIGAGHHEKVITAGKNTKFAIAADQIDAAKAIAEKYGLSIIGINQHIGSLFMEEEPYIQAVEAILQVAGRFEGLRFIDFGGGFGIPYHKLSGERDFPMERCRERLEHVLDTFVAGCRKDGIPLFKSEPGRFCVAEAGVLLGSVNAIKYNADIKYIGTDIGMNVLVRPSLYDSWHDCELLRQGKPLTVDMKQKERVTITGNICESGDILAKDRELPPAEEGDILAVLDAGAYGYSMCSSYNTRPRPAEVLITLDGGIRLIRRRETMEDILGFF